MACDGVVEPIACDLPEVSSSSVVRNPANVLSAIAVAEVRLTDSIRVRFGPVGQALDSVTSASVASGPSVSLPVLGLLEWTSYRMQVVAVNSCGATTGKSHELITESLPADLPRYTASGADPSPGYVAFAAGSYGIVIDNSGRVVWYHRFANGPGLNFQPQPNGRYAARPNATSGAPGAWLEVDVLGNITRTLRCGRGLEPRPHDLLALRDGSYWLLCDETRALDLTASGRSAQTPVQGTAIQHVSASGELLFDWSPFDHFETELGALEPADRAGTVINWTHGNSFDLDPTGNLIVSFRNLSEITKIDTRTGAVVWRMGGLRNQFTAEIAGGQLFARQHGVRATGAGEIVLLDNLGDRSQTRAERYRFDESSRSVQLTQSVASSTGAVALLGGTTQSLPGGRMLVSYGNGGSVEEYDRAGNVIWKIGGNPGYIFRATRIQSLYTPGAGDPR